MKYRCPNSACGKEIEAELEHVGDDLADVHFRCACGFSKTMMIGSNEGRVIWPSQMEFEESATSNTSDDVVAMLL